jgi:hypothetical protein
MPNAPKHRTKSYRKAGKAIGSARKTVWKHAKKFGHSIKTMWG